MNRDEWLAAFAAELGVEPPSAEDIESILALAGIAAHASERTAAPVACWIAARAETPLERSLALAKGIGPDGR